MLIVSFLVLFGQEFYYQRYLCDGCHDISIKANSMHNLAVAYNNGSAYRINFVFISKSDALNLMKKALIIL